MAARGARAAAGDAGDRVSPPRLAEANAQFVRAFRKGLAEAGYVEGQNVRSNIRWADGDNRSAAGAGGRPGPPQVAVIVTPGGVAAALAAKAATTTIPIVFAIGGDPVQAGLVASLNRPGGNVTGVSFLSSGLGGQAAGAAAASCCAGDARFARAGQSRQSAESSSRSRTCRRRPRPSGSSSIVLTASTDARDRRGLRDPRAQAAPTHCSSAPIRSSPAGGCNWPRWRRAMRCRRSTPFREFVEVGGLMSYGRTSPTRIARPASMPAASSRARSRPTCRSCRRPSSSSSSTCRPPRRSASTVPPTLLALADEVIE